MKIEVLRVNTFQNVVKASHCRLLFIFIIYPAFLSFWQAFHLVWWLFLRFCLSRKHS